MLKRIVIAALVGSVLTAGTAIPAFADPPKKGGCNAGRGNDSETTPENDCDPGNSGGNNQGGD